jgi:type I restriction enzyme S subunit
MKRYPKYKDSGIDWLGEIPEHWEKLKGKYLFKRMNRPVREYDEVVTAFRDGTVTLRSNRRLEGFTNSLKEIGYQGVRKGDLIIHAMDAFAGAIGVSDSDGKSTPVYAACQPISDANPYYYCYLIRRMSQSGYILALAKGIRERSTEFRYSEFANQEFPVPPLEEQKTIACFIDRKLVQIDQFISNKQRFIELLKEQKRAIVNRAVTKGLNPDAPMKPSGIEFYPPIPEDWEMVKLGHLCWKIADGPHFSPSYVDEGIMFLSARNVKTDSWSLEDIKYISEKDYKDFCKRIIPEIGDILYTKGGTTGVARVVDLKERFQVWVHIAVLKLKKQKINPYLLAYILNSSMCYEQSQLYTRGATNQDLGLTRMINIVFAIPPILEEQQDIVDYLKRESEKSDLAITKAKQEIELIQEYRTTLISDAVTGKIDVRELTHNS